MLLFVMQEEDSQAINITQASSGTPTFCEQSHQNGERVQANVKKVCNHLLNLSPEEMRFLKIKPKHVDAFYKATHGIIVRPDEFTSLLKISKVGMYRQSTVSIGYKNDRIGHFSDPLQQKLILHDFGHFFQKQRGYLPSILTGGNLIGSLLSRSTLKKPLQVITGIGMGALAYKAAHISEALACTIGALTTTPLFNYLEHLNEYDADEFADRVMPEISMREVTEKITELDGKTAQLHYENKGDLLVKRAKSLYMDDHPLRVLRIEKSERRCAEFIEYRKHHNIPSF